jgi:hypothetical protein
MTKEQYIQRIGNFGKMREDFSCKKTAEKYPYFLVARLLQAVDEKSEDNSVLAVVHPDRTRLLALLQTKKTAVKEKEVTEKEVPKKETAVVEKKEDLSSVLQKRLREIAEKQEDTMSILQKRLDEIAENKKEEEDGISEDLEPLFEPQASVSLDELVEKFNNYPPSITPIVDDFGEAQPYKDLGKYSSMERMNIISETLAEIYISQKLFDKAIKIYQELSLKYPEKNAIFASLIEKLKNNVKED